RAGARADMANPDDAALRIRRDDAQNCRRRERADAGRHNATRDRGFAAAKIVGCGHVPPPLIFGALYYSSGLTRLHGRHVKRAAPHGLPSPRLWGEVTAAVLPKRGVRRKSPALPRRLEVTEHAGAQLGLLLGCPGAKAFASFHSELALGDELFQVRRW